MIDVTEPRPLPEEGDHIVVLHKPTGQPYNAIVTEVKREKIPPTISFYVPAFKNELLNAADWEILWESS